MTNNPPEHERFYTNIMGLTDLMHELSCICWEEGCEEVNPQLVSFARSYLGNQDKIYLIETFINYSWEYWDEIKDRNEDFFIEHANDIFQHLPIKSDNINAFKTFMTAQDEDGNFIIIKDDKDAMWDYFDAMVKISIKYIHKAKRPKLIEKPEGMVPVYTSQKFREIKVRAIARAWGMELIPKN